MRRASLATLPLGLLLASACADDPVYVQPGTQLEVGADGLTFAATVQVPLPIRTERADESTERAARAAALMVEVPYVTVEDLDVELEWTLRNLADVPTTARIQLSGASERLAYVPVEAVVVDPGAEEEEAPPPPLMGDVPMTLDAQATVSGVFREDEIVEGSLDLELMSRGGLSPFTAVLRLDQALTEVAVMAGTAVPREAWASLVRFDLTLLADQHVVLEYAVRVRDHRDPHLLHPLLYDAPAGELAVFEPVLFMLPPPPP